MRLPVGRQGAKIDVKLNFQNDCGEESLQVEKTSLQSGTQAGVTAL